MILEDFIKELDPARKVRSREKTSIKEDELLEKQNRRNLKNSRKDAIKNGSEQVAAEFKCFDCGQEFNKRFLMRDHIEKVHKLPKICSKCFTLFNYSRNLKRH
jgi:uncharacterized CHY-type Zn-finger protein